MIQILQILDVCRRQMMTTKVDPRSVRVKNISYDRRSMTYMWRELTKTFIMISNWKNPFVSMNFTKRIPRFKGNANRDEKHIYPATNQDEFVYTLSKSICSISRQKNGCYEKCPVHVDSTGLKTFMRYGVVGIALISLIWGKVVTP